MKNIWILALLAVFALVGCGPTSSVLTGSVPVKKMLDDLDGKQLNILKVIEYHEKWMTVEVNGAPMTLTPDSKLMENTAYILNVDENGIPSFGRMDFFNTKLWDLEKENNPQMWFYVFRNDLVGSDGSTAESLVLAGVDSMHWVTATKWEGTQAAIVIWEYPMITPMIVHNVDTNEDTFVAVGFAEDGEGNSYELVRGQVIWGNLHYLPDQAVGMGGIEVYESVK